MNFSHTIRTASRFHAGTNKKPAFRVVYLADNAQTALFETGALFGTPAAPIPVSGSWLFMDWNINLQRVVDLTNTSEQAKIETNSQELTGDWTLYYRTALAPSQELGHALFADRRVEGLIYPSAKVHAKCLLVFPDKLLTGSSLCWTNPKTNTIEIPKP
jgi:RES domain-containing protein